MAGQVRLTLREWREKRALSMRELAELSGVALRTIWRLEHGGGYPYPSTRRKLAQALGVEPDQIVFPDYAPRRDH
jgi:transcriptional regulator with XRE-family HTH domain